jgi:hypothetical protein
MANADVASLKVDGGLAGSSGELAPVSERLVPHHRRRRLAQSPVDSRGPTHTVARHPGDGWTLAEPYRLSRRGERALRGLLRVFLPPPPAPQLTSELEEKVVRQALQLLQYMHPMTRLGMRFALAVVDQAPRWGFVSWRRLHQLPRERADRLLDRMGHSRIPVLRTLVFVVRGLILSMYFDQSEVHEALGYAPVAFQNERIALRQRLLRGAEPQPGDRLGPWSEAAT